LQRAATRATAVSAVPPLVQEVLRTPGQPLDASSRAYFEPRFGQDFSGVRVHTDARAAQSARAVDALAYTVGQHIVFDAGQYAPGTPDGRRLLAHELAHVVQQGPVVGMVRQVSRPTDPLERAAEALGEAVVHGGGNSATALAVPYSAGAAPRLSRRIARRMMSCPANDATLGTPADPFADLTDRDARAGRHTARVAHEISTEVSRLRSRLGRDATAVVETAFEARFGLPNAQGKGFLNRLTGQVRPTFDEALAEELHILSRRFSLLARLFNQWIHYRCLDTAVTFAGCAASDCTPTTDAQACADRGVIFLCAHFWDLSTFDAVEFADQQAMVLVHESSHMYWADVGDDTLRGPGRNFRHAECYARYLADVIGFTPARGPDCPDPPTP
jgi:hypothetical protein